MINSSLAKRYAKALLEIGREDGNQRSYGGELAALAELLASSPELMATLANPAISPEERGGLLGVFLSRLGCGPMVGNLARLLLDRGRMSLLPAVGQAYAELLDQAEGVVRARVVSAAPLDEAALARLKAALAAMAGREVRLEVSQDPKLVGGVVTRIGDRVLDGSLATQLRGLTESLRRGE